MNSHLPSSVFPVTLTDHLAPDAVEREGARREAALRRDITAGEALRAQTRARVGTGLALGTLHILIIGMRPERVLAATIALQVALIAILYVAWACLVHLYLRHRRPASPTQVTTVLFADILFVILWTAASTAPGHYERALFGMAVTVHVANFYFGKRQAWRTLIAGACGFLILVAVAVSRGLPVDVAEELWSLALCCAGSLLMVLQATDVRRRLRRIVTLFEHVEEGDFGQTYDVEADRRPDAITRVGQAYNGVRLQLANMVFTDPLTGCLNRRGFDHALGREVARTARAAGSCALLAVDLDHFKAINDTYGHMAGDIALQSVGKLLLGAARAGDVVARVGGEEFAILLADATDGGALLFATRLCDLIRAHPFVVTGDGLPIHLTTSVGVVSDTPLGMENFAA
ncbi:MAG: GGDEF domain-containing protein, partial [bacterium]